MINYLIDISNLVIYVSKINGNYLRLTHLSNIVFILVCFIENDKNNHKYLQKLDLSKINHDYVVEYNFNYLGHQSLYPLKNTLDILIPDSSHEFNFREHSFSLFNYNFYVLDYLLPIITSLLSSDIKDVSYFIEQNKHDSSCIIKNLNTLLQL